MFEEDLVGLCQSVECLVTSLFASTKLINAGPG